MKIQQGAKAGYSERAESVRQALFDAIRNKRVKLGEVSASTNCRPSRVSNFMHQLTKQVKPKMVEDIAKAIGLPPSSQKQ